MTDPYDHRERRRQGDDVQSYRNATHAFVSNLQNVLATGGTLEARGQGTRELVDQTFTLLNPLERCITLPHRRNTIAATVAETMWVLAGRADVAWLSHYLPRATDFSDDGVSWAAGYGPRLRTFRGHDQVQGVLELLSADPTSRRAVVGLLDPGEDDVHRRDFPCTNWLQFQVRDGRLHMTIVMRSNDLVWGFSGINAFEWSVLQELVARWLGVPVGRQTYFVGSMNLYDRHVERASKILAAWSGQSTYDEGSVPVAYTGTWDEFDTQIRRWFDAEEKVRADPQGTSRLVEEFPEPLFAAFLGTVRAHWLLQIGDRQAFQRALLALEGTDLAVALREFESRT